MAVSVYDAAQHFLQARRALQDSQHRTQRLRLQLEEARGQLGQAFADAANLVVGDGHHDEEDLLAGLSSFSLVEGRTCYTLVFSDQQLQSVIEGPVLAPPSLP